MDENATVEAVDAPHFYKLDHFEIGPDDEIYDAEDHRIVGFFSSEEKLAEAIAVLRGKAGFRDWPDGFRWYADYADEVFWSGRGHCLTLDEFGDDLRVEDHPWPEDLRVLYQVVHFRRLRPGEEPRTFPDRLAPANIGAFTSLALAEAVIRLVRDNEDFAPWPDGFRIFARRLDEIAFPNGYDPSDAK